MSEMHWTNMVALLGLFATIAFVAWRLTRNGGSFEIGTPKIELPPRDPWPMYRSKTKTITKEPRE